MEKIDELIGFIEENSKKYFAYPGDRFINRNLLIEYLQQLKSSLPTKQDKVVVPEFIKNTMEQYGSLQEMLTEEYYSDCTDEIDDDTVECWIDDNFDLLCRAWLNKSDNKLKLQFPQSVVDWLGMPAEGDHDELLSYIMRYYWNEDSAYDDTIPSEVGEYLAESLSNVVKLLRAVEGEPYTAAKEPLYYVVFNKLGHNHHDCYLWIDEPNNGYVYFSDKPTMGKNKFTEQEIKAIDERYWAFAVPVGEASL